MCTALFHHWAHHHVTAHIHIGLLLSLSKLVVKMAESMTLVDVITVLPPHRREVGVFFFVTSVTVVQNLSLPFAQGPVHQSADNSTAL